MFRIFHTYKKGTAPLLRITYQIHKLSELATGSITAGNTTGQSVTVEVPYGTELQALASATNNSQFISWSDQNLNRIQTVNLFTHTAIVDTTFYAVIDKNQITSKVFCYLTTIDKDTLCHNCPVQVTIYFDTLDLARGGYEQAYWYTDVNLTTRAPAGWYRLYSVGMENVVLYEIVNGVPINVDYCVTITDCGGIINPPED